MKVEKNGTKGPVLVFGASFFLISCAESCRSLKGWISPDNRPGKSVLRHPGGVPIRAERRAIERDLSSLKRMPVAKVGMSYNW
ncbi:hypothetical protein [Azoarcus taiwanensis]|uniref:Uncharacterized protein n=1 Tax=Azoarcus taiwanensis TaxID=666964 RepID=A0A972F8J3_9RHOO|nr:hypothetical protein [Azoarcus taiwanensis]NMG03927.1 hypothetical protein [Azoarcus taiwanensis]